MPLMKHLVLYRYRFTLELCVFACVWEIRCFNWSTVGGWTSN